jgi:hypothetical protein
MAGRRRDRFKKSETSFSEEKEAKRLFHPGRGRLKNRGFIIKSFCVAFFKKRLLALHLS